MGVSKDASSEIESARSKVTTVVVIALACLAVSHLVYWFWFAAHGAAISQKSDVWGTYGDFIGGIANPIVSLATLLIVARAYLLQREELVETRKALTESAAEQARLAEVSRLQGQIHAHAAVLARRVAHRNNLFSEIQRLTSEDRSKAIMSFEGEIMSRNHFDSKIAGLLKALGVIDDGIELSQERLQNLIVTLEGMAGGAELGVPFTA